MHESIVGVLQKRMEDHKVDEALQKHVMEYHSYLWMRNRGMRIQDLLQDVPYCLRSDVFFFVVGDFLTHVNYDSETAIVYPSIAHDV